MTKQGTKLETTYSNNITNIIKFLKGNVKTENIREKAHIERS